MTTYADVWKAAYKDMDPVTGHFPSHLCLGGCGKMLDDENGRNPAETYAGTYTGLCYRCSMGPPVVMAVFTFDGAQKVSWPPSCPSWRRSRETFYGYPECENCKGMGATRGWNNHSPIWNHCKDCLKRFSGARREYRDLETSIFWFGTWGLRQRVAEAGGKPFKGKLTLKVLDKRCADAAKVLGDEEVRRLTRQAYEEFKAERAKWQEFYGYLFATRRP
jgi:hypothetical protein